MSSGVRGSISKCSPRACGAFAAMSVHRPICDWQQRLMMRSSAPCCGARGRVRHRQTDANATSNPKECKRNKQPKGVQTQQPTRNASQQSTLNPMSETTVMTVTVTCNFTVTSCSVALALFLSIPRLCSLSSKALARLLSRWCCPIQYDCSLSSKALARLLAHALLLSISLCLLPLL